MPTGAKHTYGWEDADGVPQERECRCMSGTDHHQSDDQGRIFDGQGGMWEPGDEDELEE